jgi:hypothetical protein
VRIYIRNPDLRPLLPRTSTFKINSNGRVPPTNEQPHPRPPQRVAVFIWNPDEQVTRLVDDPTVMHLKTRAVVRWWWLVGFHSRCKIPQEVAPTADYIDTGVNAVSAGSEKA